MNSRELGAIAERILPNLFASLVLFLIGIPLNLGIALASGASATQGLITGVVAALVVSLLAGAPLMVSAPATGLIAVVWQITDRHGMEGLGLVVLMAGLFQILIGILSLGPWFRAVTPAVIQGMLAGIGILIFASQFHVMLGQAPNRAGLHNIVTIPGSTLEALTSAADSPAFQSAAIGIVTIFLFVGWVYVPGRLRLVPPPLVGVTGGVLVAYLGQFEVAYVTVPENLSSEFHFFSWETFRKLKESSMWGSILGLTFIATAQTLLTATAVDRLHSQKKTDYNKEVIAQGAGNMMSGFLGALPLCGVIVRSAANIQSGGNTRWSNFLHGIWLVLFVVFLSNLLALIPIPTLAAVLVCTGVRLVRVDAIDELRKFGSWELVIYAVTVITVVAFDLLTGILAGFGLSALRLLYNLTHCEIVVEQGRADGPVTVCLRGSATFFTLPKLARRLESLPKGTEIEVLVEHLTYIDHACLEQILIWEEEYIARGGRISIAWNHLMGRFNSSPSRVTSTESPSLHLREAARDVNSLAPEDRSVKLLVSRDLSTSKFLDKEIWELAALLPGDILIAWVERGGDLLVPKGKKRLLEQDVMTIVGGSQEIALLKRDYSDAL